MGFNYHIPNNYQVEEITFYGDSNASPLTSLIYKNNITNGESNNLELLSQHANTFSNNEFSISAKDAITGDKLTTISCIIRDNAVSASISAFGAKIKLIYIG